MDEVLDRLPGGYLSFGDDSVVIETNTTLRAMLGYQAGEIEGRHVENLLTVPSRIFYQTHVFPLLKMQGHIGEVYLAVRAKSGEEVPVLINGTRLHVDGAALNECLLVAMRRRNEYEDEILKAKRAAEQATEARDRMHEALLDVNAALERKQKELADRNCELEKLQEGLELMVQERTAELTSLVRELQGFNYSIAHDLRQPLRAILSTTAMLLKDEPENLREEQKYLLERQRHNAQKLASLLEDLLLLSRLGLQPVNRQDLDLSQLAEEAAHITVADQQRDNIELHIEQGVTGSGDPSLVLLVLRNLFENAVKYSPKGGKITFGQQRTAQGRAYFVRDQGIGIDPVYWGKIFKPFERLHREEDYPGNGIGLASVDRVIRRHGGRIWLDSSPGQGSIFFFTLGDSVEDLTR